MTTASPDLTLGTTAPTLSDTAVLSGGNQETGTLTFTLSGPAGFTATVTDTVNGDGSYSARVTLPTTGTVAGTYTWAVSYSGDANNHAAIEPNMAGSGTVTLDGLTNYSITGFVSANDGQGDILSNVDAYLGQLAVTFQDTAGNQSSFYTFCIDPVHEVGVGQTYAVNVVDSLAPAHKNSAAMAYLYQTYGMQDLANDPQTAAAVAIAEMDLSLNNQPTPTTFTADGSGYSSGDASVFYVSGIGSALAAEVNTVLGEAAQATTTVQGAWLDASLSGNSLTRGQSLILPGETTIVNPSSPTIVTTASPDVTLGTTAPTISDTALLSGGYYETGSLTFTVSGPNGFSYRQTDTVNGNGPYSASVTLPTTGTVAGSYTWKVSYSGDGNNVSYTEVGSALNGEQTVVNPASPTIVTTASPNITLPSSNIAIAVTISDTAVLGGGYFPGGSITFTLTGPAGFAAQTQNVTVSGDGIYRATPVLVTSAGTYHWTATYSGDANSNAAVEPDTQAEKTAETTIVEKAGPTVPPPFPPAATVPTAFPFAGASPTPIVETFAYFVVPGQPLTLFTTGAEAELGSISGVVFRDDNGNGMRDVGEQGIADQIVYLERNGVVVAFTWADDKGYYIFDGLRADVYRVRTPLSPPWAQTTTADDRGMYVVTLPGGLHETERNFGAVPAKGPRPGRVRPPISLEQLAENAAIGSIDVFFENWNERATEEERDAESSVRGTPEEIKNRTWLPFVLSGVAGVGVAINIDRRRRAKDLPRPRPDVRSE
jgi:hypothetical protein